jgi:hypothetical protein
MPLNGVSSSLYKASTPHRVYENPSSQSKWPCTASGRFGPSIVNCRITSSKCGWNETDKCSKNCLIFSSKDKGYNACNSVDAVPLQEQYHVDFLE